jgi:hypothetical protein
LRSRLRRGASIAIPRRKSHETRTIASMRVAVLTCALRHEMTLRRHGIVADAGTL